MTELQLTADDVFAAFPELQGAGYSDETCAFYLEESQAAITVARFGKRTAYAQKLFVAHHLVLLSTPAGGISGKSTVADEPRVASKAVGSANVSYDNTFGIDTNAGWWNRTKYGQALWEIMKRYRRRPFVVVGRALVP